MQIIKRTYENGIIAICGNMLRNKKTTTFSLTTMWKSKYVHMNGE